MGSGGGGPGGTTRIGGDSAAHGAQQSARAQLGAAKKNFKRTNKILRGAEKDMNAATVSSLANFDTALAAQERDLARQEQMIASIDPTILEASQQALRLLRGETSSTLAPLQRQRDMQRQKLAATLRERLGPGAETSTAGMQALTRFDAETDSMFGAAQQQALGNLGNIGGQFSQMRPDMLRSAQGYANLGVGRQGIEGNRANFKMAMADKLFQHAQGQTEMAGAKYTASTMRGLEQQKAGFMMANLGGSMLGGMGGGGGGGGGAKSENVDYSSMNMAGGSYNDYSGTA